MAAKISREKMALAAGNAPASVLEREARQNTALHVVRGIARAAGNGLSVVPAENGTFSERHGIYLLDPSIESRGPVKGIDFAFEERMLSGAADSAHAVIAGKLTVAHETGESSQVEVAAKCYQKRSFEERMLRAHREVDVMRDMASRGEIAIDPVAVVVAPDRSHGGEPVVLLTRFNDNLQTLDNNPWARGPINANVEAATLAAGALGRFNAMGYLHGDSKIKNVASIAGCGVGMIDFETTTKIDLNDPVEVRDAAYADLDYMLGSLSDRGMFALRRNGGYGDNSGQIVDAVQRVCEDGYLSAWADAPSDVQSAVYDVVVEAADNVLTRSLGSHELV